MEVTRVGFVTCTRFTLFNTCITLCGEGELISDQTMHQIQTGRKDLSGLSPHLLTTIPTVTYGY